MEGSNNNMLWVLVVVNLPIQPQQKQKSDRKQSKQRKQKFLPRKSVVSGLSRERGGDKVRLRTSRQDYLWLYSKQGFMNYLYLLYAYESFIYNVIYVKAVSSHRVVWAAIRAASTFILRSISNRLATLIAAAHSLRSLLVGQTMKNDLWGCWISIIRCRFF